MKIAVIAGWEEPEQAIGILDVAKVRGTERIMFEMNKEWIQSHPYLMLDPDLAQFAGPQYPPADKKMFGFLEDASPDRSNCDDHLRNHGFMLDHNGWHLSPAFDLNPVSAKDELSLNITDTDNRRIPENVVAVAEFFRVSHASAIAMKEEMMPRISENWKRIAAKYRIKEDEIQYMEAAYALNN